MATTSATRTTKCCACSRASSATASARFGAGAVSVQLQLWLQHLRRERRSAVRAHALLLLLRVLEGCDVPYYDARRRRNGLRSDEENGRHDGGFPARDVHHL